MCYKDVGGIYYEVQGAMALKNLINVFHFGNNNSNK